MANLIFADLDVPAPVPKRFMRDWRDYVALSEHVQSQVDIATFNLVCASGLPGGEEIDVRACVETLNSWAATVKRWTDAAYREYFLTDPGQFRNSEAFFRTVSLVIALQRHCGVHYDPLRKGLGPDDPFEFDDYFIFSIIQGKGGTCATLPIIYAAVGRRLGYPIKLVCAKRHLFSRWDDPKTGERHNMEGAGDGFNSYPDEHYRKWPRPITESEEHQFGYLRSLSPREELAHGVAGRAAFLEDHNRHREAAEAYAVACDLDGQCGRFRSSLVDCMKKWKVHLQSYLPKRFPKYEVLTRPQERLWPSSIPWDIEREYAALEGLEKTLTDSEADRQWWKPLREGRPPLVELPTTITYHFPRIAGP